MGVTPSPQAPLVIPALIGDARAAGLPATWKAHLGYGDPRASGTELTSAGGYVAQNLSNASSAWTGIASGLAVSVAVTFPVTGAYSDDATHAWLTHPSHPTWLFAVQALSSPIVITAAGDTPPSVKYRVADAAIGVV